MAGNFEVKIHYHTARVLGMIVNVYLVETENAVVLIDGAIAISSGREIRQMIDKQIGKPLLAVLLTHGHPDHYVGVVNIIGDEAIPFFATQGAIEQAMERDRTEASAMQAAFGDDFPPIRRFPDTVVRDGDVLEFDGVCFTVKDYGACESDADAVWHLTVNGIRHVFIGDLLYNHMHLFLKDGHALNWLKVLEELYQTYEHGTVFYPSHGPSCGKEIIFWNIAYINMYLETLRGLKNGTDVLPQEELDKLLRAMKSFLPSDDLFQLAQYKIDETVKVLAKQVAR